MKKVFKPTYIFLFLFTIFAPELLAQSSGATSTTTVTIPPPETHTPQEPAETVSPPDSGNDHTPTTPATSTAPNPDSGQTTTTTVTVNPPSSNTEQTSTTTVTISPPSTNEGQTSTTTSSVASSDFGSAATTTATATLAVTVPPPEDPTPEVNNVVSNDGSTNNSKMSIGAYSGNGTQNFSNDFIDGDFITVIGEISPDPNDVGKNGEIFVVVGSLIQGNFIPTFLDVNGNLIHWDLSIHSLEPAAIATPLQENLQIRIFEGVLQAGIHRFFFAYMAEDGPLIYTGSALKFKVAE